MHGLRQHPRFRHTQPVTVGIGGVQMQAETRDVSAGGLFVATERDLFELHGEIELNLRIGANGEPATYTGQVRHVRRNDEGAVTGLGVMLINITDDSRTAWMAHLDYVQQLCNAPAEWFSCEYPATLSNNHLEVSVEVRDMSATGLYVAITSDAFTRGDKLELRLISATRESLLLAVQVVRVRKDSFGKVTAMGLKIIDETPALAAWQAHVAAGG